MSRFVPSRSTAVVVAISTLFLIAISTAGVKGTGQAPAAAKPAQSTAPPTAAQVAPFVGDWLVTVYLQAIEASVVVSVKADGGKPSATISSDTQPTTNVSGMAMAGNRLILRYSVDMGGTPISTVMTLTPDGPGLRAEMAVMDGQYELTGTGTRQTPGAPRRASGFGGGGRGAQTNEATDFSPKPPYTARTAAEEARGFMLPAGYRMELIASDPDIISPSLIEFDGNGRMYVGEMISYMMDASATREHDPISRISRWESTKGDGHYDKHTVFVDHLVAPRMILPLQDGVILTSETDSDDIVKWSDTNGDGVADKREVVFTGIGQSGDANIEHQKAGLLWNMDNWIYTTYNPFRIRWTPTRLPPRAHRPQWRPVGPRVRR